ncbi:MAG: ATP-binding protein [Planctomycetota bacterium]
MSSHEQQQELKIKFSTSPEYTHKIFDIIEELMDMVVLDKEDRNEFIIALGEALDNAITHGNKLDRQKFIHIECYITPDQICCSIMDEGDGFDHQSYLNKPMEQFYPEVLMQKARKGEIGGLGIGLIRKCVNEVSFSQGGRKIILMKQLARNLVKK